MCASALALDSRRSDGVVYVSHDVTSDRVFQEEGHTTGRKDNSRIVVETGHQARVALQYIFQIQRSAKTMIRTIQAAFAPLLIVSMFSGVYVFEYPAGRPRPYLAWLYVLCVWSIYICIYYYLRIATKEQIISLPWSVFVIMISSFVSMIASLFRFKVRTCGLYSPDSSDARRSRFSFSISPVLTVCNNDCRQTEKNLDQFRWVSVANRVTVKMSP